MYNGTNGPLVFLTRHSTPLTQVCHKGQIWCVLALTVQYKHYF